MVRKKAKPPAADEARKRFIAAARELGCDESETAFADVMRKLVTVKPMTNDDVKRSAQHAKKRRKSP